MVTRIAHQARARVIGYVIVTLTLDTLETPATLVRAMLQMAGLLLVLHLQTRDWW